MNINIIFCNIINVFTVILMHLDLIYMSLMIINVS